MDLLDRFLQHDHWTTRQLLLQSQLLADSDLDREFDLGHETLRKTFVHIISNMETWTGLLYSRTSQNNLPSKEASSIPGLLARLNKIAPEFSNLARQIQNEGRWDDVWTDFLDNPPTRKTYGGTIGHLITHSMHHRSEALHLMQRLGLSGLPEGDMLSWEAGFRSHNL